MNLGPIIKIISVIAGSTLTIINVSNELKQAKNDVKEAAQNLKNK